MVLKSDRVPGTRQNRDHSIYIGPDLVADDMDNVGDHAEGVFVVFGGQVQFKDPIPRQEILQILWNIKEKIAEGGNRQMRILEGAGSVGKTIRRRNALHLPSRFVAVHRPRCYRQPQQ